MDFFRHCYSPIFYTPENNDLITNFLTDLSDFGFVSTETNEGLYESFYFDNLTDMYWKNDLLHQARIRKEHGSIQSIDFGELQFCLSTGSSPGNSLVNWGYDYYNTSSQYYSARFSYIVRNPATQSSSPASNSRNSVIMIPLINGGFIYNVMSSQQYITSVQPTPKLIIRGTLEEDYVNDTSKYCNNNLTIIGIPPTVKSSINNYIYFGIYCYANDTYSTSLTEKFLTDYQNGRVLDYIPYITKNVPLIENTCVLTKMPHDNGYLDNVYMMSTRPGPLTKRGSIFSFAGRNFINVIDNLVLELPS